MSYRVRPRIVVHKMRCLYTLWRASLTSRHHHIHSRTITVCHSRPFISRRMSTAPLPSGNEMSANERAIFKRLTLIPTPQTPTSPTSPTRDIVYDNYIAAVSERDGVVNISVRLDQHYRTIKKAIGDALNDVSFVKQVHVAMHSTDNTTKTDASSKPPPTISSSSSASTRPGRGLSGVRHIIAVSSCKGGVGKSTVAVNLAYALSRQSLRVGIFDADVYGPSLPTLIGADQQYSGIGLRQDADGLITPIDHFNVKSMSYGYMRRKGATESGFDTGAFMRGSMVSSVVTQLVSHTGWGILDYLIIDMPPGTGDIVLTLTQSLRIAGAVVVTTPQRISVSDVVKGIRLFETVKVPIVALVENMATFTCGHCGTDHRPFGNSHVEEITRAHNDIPIVTSLPMVTQIALASDSGHPFVLADYPPQSDEDVAKQNYVKLAHDIHRNIQSRVAAVDTQVRFDETDKLIHCVDGSDTSANKTRYVHPLTLRAACTCAGCIDELSGRSLLRANALLAAPIKPLSMTPRGNYAVSVRWSDGHNSSLYAIDRIRDIAVDTAQAAIQDGEKTTQRLRQ